MKIAIKKIKENLSSMGFKVFVVPEVPTLTVQGGGIIV